MTWRAEHTNFHFEIPSQHFEDALARFVASIPFSDAVKMQKKHISLLMSKMPT
jgi:hypothetical protein